MCDIYRHSVLTIAASCSASDSAGFLQHRMAARSLTLKQPARLRSLRLRETVDHRRMLREDPIHSRAWTFQETMLPHRLLSFCSREMTWECEKSRHCECGRIDEDLDEELEFDSMGRAAFRRYTDEIIKTKHVNIYNAYIGAGLAKSILREAPPEHKIQQYWCYIQQIRRRDRVSAVTAHSTLNPTLNPSFTNVSPIESSSEPDDTVDGETCASWLETKYSRMLTVRAFYRYWRRVLVPEFTRRALSRDSDRLVALQAIAEDIRLGIKDRYMAGLWRGDLLRQLCWASLDQSNLSATNVNPSWSWSSVRGPIGPYLNEDTEDGQWVVMAWKGRATTLRDLSIQYKPAGSSLCGNIEWASIRVRATGLNVWCRYNQILVSYEFSKNLKSKRRQGIQMCFSPDTPLAGGPSLPVYRCLRDDPHNLKCHDWSGPAILLIMAHDGQKTRVLVIAEKGPKYYHRIGIGECWTDQLIKLWKKKISENQVYELV